MHHGIIPDLHGPVCFLIFQRESGFAVYITEPSGGSGIAVAVEIDDVVVSNIVRPLEAKIERFVSEEGARQCVHIAKI